MSVGEASGPDGTLPRVLEKSSELEPPLTLLRSYALLALFLIVASEHLFNLFQRNVALILFVIPY